MSITTNNICSILNSSRIDSKSNERKYPKFKNEMDTVSFSGNKPDKPDKYKNKTNAKAGLLATLAVINGVFGASGCAQKSIQTDKIEPSQSVGITIPEAPKLEDGFSAEPIKTVTVFMTVDGHDDKVRTFTNKKYDESTNGKFKIPNEKTTLNSIIESSFGSSLKEAEKTQIALKIIENDIELQKKIVGESNEPEKWKNADINEILNAGLKELGVKDVKIPKEFSIYTIPTMPYGTDKTYGSNTTIYRANTDEITLNVDEINTPEDIYEAFSEAYGYKDKNGEFQKADKTASSIIAIEKIGDMKIFNKQEWKSDYSLLENFIKAAKKDKSEKGLENFSVVIHPDKNFAITTIAPGKEGELDESGILTDDNVTTVHQMAPRHNSIFLPETKEEAERLDMPTCFSELGMEYIDPNTKKPLLVTIDGKVQKNPEVEQVEAKLSAVLNSIAFENIEFFASKYANSSQDENHYGIFKVKEGYEKQVAILVNNKKYDKAAKYLTLDETLDVQFFNQNGNRIKGAEQIRLEPFNYISNNAAGKSAQKDNSNDENIEDNTDNITYYYEDNESNNEEY